MAPPKKKTQGERILHQGRVTGRERNPVTEMRTESRPADAPAVPATERRHVTNRRAAAPLPTPARVTEPRRFRVRSGRHKAVGWGLVLGGVGLAVVNDVMLLQPSLTLLPGGHNELFLVAGVAAAGWGTWWFGWFDRTR